MSPSSSEQLRAIALAFYERRRGPLSEDELEWVRGLAEKVALQASIGLNIRYTSGEVKNTAEFGAGGIAQTETDFSVGTDVADIFNGVIRATYYF